MIRLFLLLVLLGFSACSEGQQPSSPNSGGISELLEPTAFQAAIQQSPGIVLDVRTPEEFSQGHLKGAVNLNINDPSFEGEIMKLEKVGTVYVYCAVGGRSAKAQTRMKQLGFPAVVNLKGGFNAWSAAGLPSEK